MNENFIAYVNEKVNKFNDGLNVHHEKIDQIMASSTKINFNDVMSILVQIDVDYLVLCKELSDPSADKQSSEFANGILSEIGDALLAYKGKVIEALKRGNAS